MTDIALRRLVATACVFLIVAVGVFLATEAYKMYGAYQQDQAASLDRTISEHQRLVDQLNRRR